MANRSRVTPKTALVGRPSGAVICGIAWNIWKMRACVSSRYRVAGESGMTNEVPIRKTGAHSNSADNSPVGGGELAGDPSGVFTGRWGNRVRTDGRVAGDSVQRQTGGRWGLLMTG